MNHIGYKNESVKFSDNQFLFMCDATNQFLFVMQADSFWRPYEFVPQIYKPLQMATGDFTLAIDEQKKKVRLKKQTEFSLFTASQILTCSLTQKSAYHQ